PVGGTVDQAGGLAVRLLTPDDYYVVRANALEDNIRFYRVVKGRLEQIDGVNRKVASNQWHKLGLRAGRRLHGLVRWQDAFHGARQDLRRCGQGRSVDQGR